MNAHFQAPHGLSPSNASSLGRGARYGHDAVIAGPAGRLGTQDRLLNALTRVAARDGYVSLTVERILATAGVSRATFYQYFSNIDDCFWTAYRRHADRLVADVVDALGRHESPTQAVIDVLIATATCRPDVARLLMREGLAAGPAGMIERDALISRIEHAMTAAETQRYAVDLPPRIMTGAAFRFLSVLLTGSGVHERLGGDIRSWVGAFARPSAQPAWSTRFSGRLVGDTSQLHRQLSPMSALGTTRERILRATIETIATKSYRDVSVEDIVGVARVSRRAFYNQFPSKADAFIASYEDGFQHTLSACTPAFFNARAWPERVWNAAQALTGLLARDPWIAYLGFVDCHAIGPRFAPRVHDTQLAFTLFLEDGYRARPEAQSPSRAWLALTVMAVIELGFQVSRRNPSMALRGVQPLAVYITLAPFIGLDDACEFVNGKIVTKASGASLAMPLT